jgi:hypothetical protein
MENHQRVLFVDAATAFYRIDHYKVGDFFGPVDLGLFTAAVLFYGVLTNMKIPIYSAMLISVVDT